MHFCIVKCLRKDGLTDMDERKKTIKQCIYFLSVFAVFLLINNFIFLGKIPTKSMEPTLEAGDFVLVLRKAYTFNDVRRGDIVCFSMEDKLYAKRVIGVSGDKVTIEDGKVFINDLQLDESGYLAADVETKTSDSSFTFVVPEGEVFLLGDNRDNSVDSRVWEGHSISTDSIKGKVVK